MGKYSTILFASPSFLEGAGRLVDFGGFLNVYNESSTPELADARAIAADWCAVGSDLKAALDAGAPGGSDEEQSEEE